MDLERRRVEEVWDQLVPKRIEDSLRAPTAPTILRITGIHISLEGNESWRWSRNCSGTYSESLSL